MTEMGEGMEQKQESDLGMQKRRIVVRALGCFLVLIIAGILLVSAGIGPFVFFAVAIVCAGIASKFIKPNSEPMLDAFAVQSAQILFIILSIVFLVFLSQGSMIILLAVLSFAIAMVAGVAWLVVRPGLGSVILLTILQGVLFLANLRMLISSEFRILPYGSIIASMIMEASAVFLMFRGLSLVHRQKSSAEDIHSIPDQSIE